MMGLDFGTIAGVLVTIVLAVLAITFHYPIRIIIQLAIVGIKVKLHSRYHSNGPFSILDVIEKDVDNYPEIEQLILAETGEVRTKLQMDVLANQVAHWAIGQKCKALDTVALMMLNNLDYVSIWMGFGKIGAATALINTNINGNALAHSVATALQSSEAKIFIVDDELFDSLGTELKELREKGVMVFRWKATKGLSVDPGSDKENLRNLVLSFPTTRPDKSLRKSITEKDALMYIFTSGTTGLPKACKISQTRYQGASFFFPHFCLLRRGIDRVYTCMPLYHSAAGMIAVGGALSSSVTLVLRKKFSVKAFSQDMLTYRITTVQYIGELCRYLVNAPPNPLDKQVKIRFALGNGMRPEIWNQFKSRYNVSFIAEFYTATEGNIGLFNIMGKPGALGFVPSIFAFLSPIKLVKVDPNDPSQPLRDRRTGRCIPADFNEPGLLIGQITKGDVTRRYDGYSDSKATAQKVLSNVFVRGDSYFNTGDLLSCDMWGFYYWSDRVGDTFRWKGENVSTVEVAQALTHPPASDIFSDITVYGVALPRRDGKAGMAAVVLRETVPHTVPTYHELLESLLALGSKNLPPYARPLFVRIRASSKPLPVTSTHKHIKTDLVREAYDPSRQQSPPTDVVFALLYDAKKWTAVDAAFVARLDKGEDVGLRL